MGEVHIDLNDVVESLSAQVSALSKENAYNVAIIRSLEKEVEKLRKEIIEQD